VSSGDDGGRSGERLDVLLVRRGLFASRTRAQAAILAGDVLVGGRAVRRAAERVPTDADVRVRQAPRWASRGAYKLEGALRAFDVRPAGWICLDVGASSGGFTDCLLAHGAAKVYAVDVGYGQLVWRLRKDPRVVVLERTNARYLTAAHIPEPCRLAVFDLSFISLGKVVPAVLPLLEADGELIALIKPQFEAGPREVPPGGVIRRPEVHRRVLWEVGQALQASGVQLLGLVPSPLRGQDGNVEYLVHGRRGGRPPAVAWEHLVVQAVQQGLGGDNAG